MRVGIVTGCTGATCLRFGFLPFDLFPRVGSWLEHRQRATIHHLVADGGLGAWYDHPPGTKPFRGHRQRLDRYDEIDFDDYERVLKEVSTAEINLWLVDEKPDYRSPFANN